MMPRAPAEVRADLVTALALDLVGPTPDHPYATEVLSMPPSRWYLTGFLVPYEAKEEIKTDPTSNEDLGNGSGGNGLDDDLTPEPPSARRAHFPSSIGISVLVPANEKELAVIATWGDYKQTTA